LVPALSTQQPISQGLECEREIQQIHAACGRPRANGRTNFCALSREAAEFGKVAALGKRNSTRFPRHYQDAIGRRQRSAHKLTSGSVTSGTRHNIDARGQNRCLGRTQTALIALTAPNYRAEWPGSSQRGISVPSPRLKSFHRVRFKERARNSPTSGKSLNSQRAKSIVA